MTAIRAVLAAEPDGTPGRLSEIDSAELGEPGEGDISVKVSWSSLNYKDGLAVTGKGRIARKFPLVCGIDLAGVVEESLSPRFRIGDEILVTGFGLGEEHHGGYAELALVPADWAVRLPPGLDAKRAMAIGTAGLTAMLCVMALERHGVRPGGELPVAVSGAAGGVGSVAIALLAHLGYDVAAVSGRPEQADYLTSLGAASIIDRHQLENEEPRALASVRFAGGVDVAGGKLLAALLRQTAYGGCVAACGLVGSAELATTVHPFILRGVDLAGVESVRTPLQLREEAWERLSTELDRELLDSMTLEASLEDVPQLAEEIVAGRTRGRVAIEVGR